MPFAPQVAGGSDTYATSWILDKNDLKSQRYEIYYYSKIFKVISE